MSRRVLAAALIAACCLFPFGVLALLSLVDTWPAFSALPSGLSLDRWGELVGGELLASAGLSLTIALVVSAVATVGGLAAARLVAYARWGGALLFAAYVPYLMSPVLVGVCLLALYLRLGLAGTWAGVALGHLTLALGFATVFFTAFWSRRIQMQEAAARTLGASERQVLLRVVWPQARPLALVCAVQAFLLSWFQYGLTILLGQGRVQTVTVRIFFYLNEANPYYAAVAACVLVGPPAVLLWANRRFVFRGNL
jgi:putative spermidine/putrescine transport system permease protein